MYLNEYLNQDEKRRRTLIVSSVKRLNLLVRAFEKENGKEMTNVIAVTISDMAKAIINLEEAEQGFERKYVFLDNGEATALFKTVLLKERDEGNKLLYFDGKNEILKAKATYREILDKVNLIRENDFIDKDKLANDSELSDEAEARIYDLDTLVAEYEGALEEGNGAGLQYLDSTACVFKAFQIMKGWDDVAAERKIRLLFGKEIAVLTEDKEWFSGINLAFINLLEEKRERGITEVQAFEKEEPGIEDLKNLEGKVEFFKGYGSFSEVAYIVNDIAERKHPFGEVHIVYMSPSQTPTIISELKGNDIPMCITSPYSMKDNALINFALRIIDWAESDYSETAFEGILSSGVLFVQGEDENAKYPNVAYGDRYNNYLYGRTSPEAILGWGFARNRAYANLAIETNDEETAKDKKGDAPYYRQMGMMHHSLLDIFAIEDRSDEEINGVLQTSKIYDKLLRFVEEYSFKNQERNAGITRLRALQREIAFDKEEVTLEEALSIIREHIEEIKMQDSPANDAVAVELVNDWTVLERPYVYFIGMSLKEMEMPSNESPIITDYEVEHYIGDGRKFTQDSINKKRTRGLYRTLSTFSGERIAFGYSDFAEDSFYTKLPSTVYRKLLDAYSKQGLEDVVEFEKGNPEEDKIKYDAVDLSVDIDEEGATKVGTGEDNESASAEDGEEEKELYNKATDRITSSTKADGFISCPKAFAYANIHYIPELSLREKKVNTWLEANEKGTVFHEIMADYVNEVIVEKGTNTLDDEILRRFAEKSKLGMKRNVPYPFEELTEKEMGEIIRISTKELEDLYQEMRTGDWKPISAELHFTDAIYGDKTFGGEDVSFTYNGLIDRLDYRVDSQKQEIVLRIVDYKTGKMDKQRKKVEKTWSTLQHVLYKHAVESEKTMVETGDNKKEKESLSDYLKELIGKKERTDLSTLSLRVEEFVYLFPFAKTEKKAMTVSDNLYEPAKKRLQLVLSALYDKKIYPDILELEEYVDELVENGIDVGEYKKKFYNESSKSSNPCGFCDYVNLCVNRKRGVIK